MGLADMVTLIYIGLSLPFLTKRLQAFTTRDLPICCKTQKTCKEPIVKNYLHFQLREKSPNLWNGSGKLWSSVLILIITLA